MNSNKKQDKLFQSYLDAEKIRGTRIMGVLGSLLYILFAIVDILSLSVSLEEVLMIRGGISVFLLSIVVLSYVRLKFLLKYYTVIFSSAFIVAAVGIEAMIYLSQPEDYASQVYFVGILLIIMTIYSWSFFKPIVSFMTAFTIIALYVYVEVLKGIRIEVLFVNMIFLVSGLIISFSSQIIRNRFIKENYSLQNTLKEAIKEKTIEANDYEYQANHDPLTLLPNRRYMTQLLEESLQVAKEKDKILAILFFDLNGFKQLNDVYGHAVGDEVLTIVAKRLELAIRKGDCISRLGGDEYLVGLLIDKDHASDVNTMAAKFTAIISEPMHIDGNILKVGASVGIAAYPLHGNNVSILIDIADKKMYKIKQGLQKLAEQRDQNSEPEPVVIFPGNSKSRR